MKREKNYTVFEIASVYIGTVIGAGFASGQEIMKFFTSYGKIGMLGIVLAGALHAVLGSIILEIVYEQQFKSYDELIKNVMGEKLGYVINGTVTAFLFVCFSTMLVGTGAIFNQAFGWPVWIGAVIMATVAGITFLTGSKGFVRMNSILVPVLCIGGIVLGILVGVLRVVPTFGEYVGPSLLSKAWLVSCITYVAYNTLTVLVVLASLGPRIKKVSIARWGGMLGGIGLGALALSIGICTMIYYEEVRLVEIPMLKILGYYPNLLKMIYFVVLTLAMYTTAIANGYGIVENIGHMIPVNKKYIIILMSALGLMSIKIGFSNIVEHVFPLFGSIGCFEILMLIVYYSFMKWENRGKI